MLEQTTSSLEENKASVESLNAQVVRIDDVEGVNATQAMALIDLENGKVALSEYNTLKGEVLSARDGAPSLLGKIQNLKSVDLDLQNNKASVASVEALTARTANTEADITDLENAAATDRTATAQAINQLRAQGGGFNKQRNPRWLNGWDGWPIRVGGWSYSPLAGGDASWALFGPAAAGETGLLYGEMIPWDEDKPIGLSGRRYVNSITSGVLQAYIGCYDAAGNSTGVRQVVPFFTGGYPTGQAEGAQNFVGQENQKTPAGTTQVRIQIEAVGVNAGAYLGLYYVMLSDDPRRAFTDDSTVQAIGASVTDQLLALIDLENNKASVSALNAQVVRIDGVEGVNLTQALALIDLENNKVALSEYNTLKGEVTAARGEAPSLLGQIQSLKSVDLDLEANKASVASVEALTARTANTEADITDLENALATETGARAQAVEQVRAAWRGQAINANPSFAQWPNPDQLPTGWQGSGSVTRDAGKISPYCARLTGLATLLYGGADLRAVGGGAFIIEADVRRTSSTGTFADAGILLQAFDDAGNLLPDGSKSFTISTAPLDPDLNGGGAAAGAGFQGETYRLRLFCDVRYAATRRYSLSAVSLSPGLAFDVDQLPLRPATNAEILAGVHPDVVRVVKRAIEITAQDFIVTEGVRTPERQRELYAQGRTKPGKIVTKTLTSNHFKHADGYGHAVDLTPYPVDYEGPVKFPKHEAIAKAMKAAAAELGVKIQWGGDWKGFVDRPHYELKS